MTGGGAGTNGRGDRRRGRERGGVLVEFALVAPVLIALVLGVVDFGWVLNTQAGIRQAARGVTREVVLGNFGSSTSCTLVGPTSASDPVARQVMCRAKQLAGGVQSDVRVKLMFPDGHGYLQRESAVVCIQRPMPSLSGFFSAVVSGKVITAKVDMRVEATPTGAVPLALEETPVAGSSWSFCTNS